MHKSQTWRNKLNKQKFKEIRLLQALKEKCWMTQSAKISTREFQ